MKIQEMGLDAEIPDDEWFDELRKQLEGYKVRQNNREKKRERERERVIATVSHIHVHVAPA
jgi:type II secretory pathway component PulL